MGSRVFTRERSGNPNSGRLHLIRLVHFKWFSCLVKIHGSDSLAKTHSRCYKCCNHLLDFSWMDFKSGNLAYFVWYEGIVLFSQVYFHSFYRVIIQVHSIQVITYHFIQKYTFLPKLTFGQLLTFWSTIDFLVNHLTKVNHLFQPFYFTIHTYIISNSTINQYTISNSKVTKL